MTTMSSAVSITAMLRPISPQPPSGTTRTNGSVGGAGTIKASVLKFLLLLPGR